MHAKLTHREATLLIDLLCGTDGAFPLVGVSKTIWLLLLSLQHILKLTESATLTANNGPIQWVSYKAVLLGHCSFDNASRCLLKAFCMSLWMSAVVCRFH